MTSDLHTLAGAYALDVLTDDERRRFEGHLTACDDCRMEVDGLQATAALLGAVAALLAAAVVGRIDRPTTEPVIARRLA